jgi:cytochrome c oxidase assembly protein subunit 15
MTSSTPGGVAAASDQPAAASAGGAPRVIATWLLVCCALVFALIVVGGVTRLTHSGLSITEWQPIVGTLPPLSESQWNDALAKYQVTPEYLQVNRGMSINAFKGIFWVEYVHRLLGRLVGFAFIVPLLWFTARGKLPSSPGLVLMLFGIFLLGAAQGALGWYMVQSGLVDDPRVSQLRLTAHLGLALLIFAAMFWTALTLLRPAGAAATRTTPLFRGAVSLAALIFVMALSGGLVAGIRAGFAYNTFPLMNGHVVPPEIMQISPWYMNFVNNMATVQFDHRLLAWTLLVLVPIWWWRVRATPEVPARARLAAHLLLAMLLAQVSLGISTLVLVVPLPLAALHQAGAVLLFAAAIHAAHALRRGAGDGDHLLLAASGAMITVPPRIARRY